MTSGLAGRQVCDAHEVALLRLVAHGIVGPRRTAPARVLPQMVALQAQDLWSGVTSVAVRSTNGASPSVHSAFDDGSVIRTWAPRGTLHLLAATDVRWMLDLLAPRTLKAAAGRERGLGLTATELDRAERLALQLLSERGPVGRADLARVWQQGGLDTSAQRGYHLLWHLGEAGAVVLGPMRDGEQLVAGLDAWVAPTAPRDTEEMLGDLARRYFEGHGPATVRDLRRWAKLSASEASIAVAIARADLAVLNVDGTELLLGQTTQDQLASCRRQAAGLFVLPGFDEILFGYEDRSATLAAGHADAVLTSNGIGRNTVVYDGRVVATWRRGGNEIEISELSSLPPRLRKAAVQRATELVGRAGRG